MAQVTQDYDYAPRSKRMRSSSAPGTGGVYSSVQRYKYRGPSKRYRKKVPAGTRAYVKSAISRSLENKQVASSANQLSFNPQIVPADCHSLMPSMSQGTGQGVRIGNAISVKRHMLRLVVNSIYASLTGAPTYVDIYIFKNKMNVNITTMANFLQLGSSATDYNGDGSPIVGLLSVNSDVYRSCIHHRVQVFNPRYDVTVAGGAAINPSVCMSFDLTKFLKKKLQFDDGISTVTNDNLYLAIGTCQTDGQNVAGVNTVEATWVLETEFSDA